MTDDVDHEPICFTHRLLFDKLKVLRHRDREKQYSMYTVFTLRHDITVASIQIYFEGANFFISQRGGRSPRPESVGGVLGERAASPLPTT